MPKQYSDMRDSMRRNCEKGEHPGRRDGEDCMKYAKRLASIVYYKRTGKTPQEAESDINFYEELEKFLGLTHEDNNS